MLDEKRNARKSARIQNFLPQKLLYLRQSIVVCISPRYTLIRKEFDSFFFFLSLYNQQESKNNEFTVTMYLLISG